MFCVKLLSQQFDFCMKIGRDFVRLLQDLVRVPEFQSKKDLLDVNPSMFRTEGFHILSKLNFCRTSTSHFFQKWKTS